MKIIDSIKSYFQRDKVTATRVIDLLNQGYSLLQISKDIYNIPEIRTAINFVAEKVASVPFHHIREDTDGFVQKLNDRYSFVLGIRSNPYQSPQVFWTQAVTRLLLSNNCFIMPEWDDAGNLKWMYVLPFTHFEYREAPNGGLMIRFTGTGGIYDFNYDDIIHLQRFPTDNKGGIKNQATGNYVQIVNTMQGQAVKDSATSGRIAALLQVKTALKGTDMKKKLNEFKDLFLTAENSTGFGMIGSEYDVHKLDLKINPLDTKLLSEITRCLYNYFGVSSEIINHNATELQFEQFIDNTVKPIVYQIEEELTYKLFSDNEIYHYNRIEAELVDLEISSLASKTAFYKEMVYGTVMSRNEIRKRLRMPKGPPELDRFLENKNFQVLGAGSYVVEGGDKGGQENEITTNVTE